MLSSYTRLDMRSSIRSFADAHVKLEVHAFLNTEFAGDRHSRRVAKLG